MQFSRLSHLGLFVIVVVYNSVKVASQEDSGEDSKIPTAIQAAELMVTEVSSVIEGLVDKLTTTEVPSTSPSSTNVDTSTQKTVSSSTKTPTVVPTDSVKTPNCILLDLDVMLSFNDFRKTDEWVPYYLNSSVDSEFHGCPLNVDMKKPVVFGLLTSAVALNFTAEQKTDGSAWYISSVTITYNPAEVFKDKSLEKYDEVNTNTDEYFMETPMGKSFACSGPRTIDLYNKHGKLAARVILKSIKMQIYNVPKDGTFSPESKCRENIALLSPDAVYRSETVPIVVGSCLAVITVLVIAGYAAYRSLTVKKLDYATMEE